MSKNDSQIEYSGSNPERLSIVKEAFRQTELKLVELNRIAEAAERRALGFAGFGAVISTLLVSGAPDMPIPWVSYLGGIAALFGAYRSSLSAMPRGFHTPGQLFSHWNDHLTDGDIFEDALIFRGIENDKRIKTNEKSLNENANILRWAVTIVVASSGLTALVQFAAILFY